MKTKVILQEFTIDADDISASGSFQTGIAPADFPALTSSPNYCALDGKGVSRGSQLPFLVDGSPCGFISQQLSGTNGVFSENPSLSLTFSEKRDVREITVTFFGNYCRHISAQAYGKNGIVTTVEISENEQMSVSLEWESVISDCTKIVLYFMQTQDPEQFARVASIHIGKDLIIDRYKSLRTVCEVHPASMDIPIGTVEFTGISDITPLDMERARIIPYFRGKGALGNYLIKELTPQALEKFIITGEDALGRLDGIRFDGGIYGEVRVEILLDKLSDLSGVTINAPSSINECYIAGHIPICSVRKALLLIAFAVNAVISVDLYGSVSLKERQLEPKYTIYGGTPGESNRIIGNALFEKAKPYTDLAFHTYEYGPPTDGKKTLYDSEGTKVEELRIEFDNPVFSENSSKYSMEITGTNAKIHESGVNYAIISGTDVVLTGYEYGIRDTVKKRKISESDSSPSSILSCEEFTLKSVRHQVNESRTNDVITTITRYAKSRGKVKAKIILSFDENTLTPREKVGDYIEIETAFSGMVQGYISRMEYNISQNMTADIEVTEWQI